MSTEGKKTSNSSQHSNQTTDWRLKINDLVQTCQAEIKKTTKIGIKMLSASQSSTQLQAAHEDLGKWLCTQIKAGKISLSDEDEKAKSLIEKVEELESQLESFEKDVQSIKSSD